MLSLAIALYYEVRYSIYVWYVGDYARDRTNWYYDKKDTLERELDWYLGTAW